MNVKQLIEWLQTQDQEATVTVVKHSQYGCGYYEQGGTATTVDFDSKVDYDSPGYAYGVTWEFYEDSKGNKTLLLGIHNG